MLVVFVGAAVLMATGRLPFWGTNPHQGLKLIVDSPPRYARFEMPEGGSSFSIEKVEGVGGSEWPLIWFERPRKS